MMGGCHICSNVVVERPIPKQPLSWNSSVSTRQGGSMRIKQRARAVNGEHEWVYGTVVDLEGIKVAPDTVGLYASTVDNTDFYEGDIIQTDDGKKGVIRHGEFTEVTGQTYIGFFIDWNNDNDNDTLLKSAAYWLKSERVSIVGTEK